MGREGGREEGMVKYTYPPNTQFQISKLMCFNDYLLWEIGVSVCRRVQHRNITRKTEQAE